MRSGIPPNHSLSFSPSCIIYTMNSVAVCFFLCSVFCVCAAPLSYSSGLSVCSSAPVSMKIQPLNQTALMVSWERPLTIYHPPIASYMVSYSWVKSDVADEKTFTKTGDQRTVSITNCLSEPANARIIFFLLFSYISFSFSAWMWFEQFRFFFFKTSDVCGRIRGWLDQWQCVEEVTGCDELCLWLLDDMRAQTLPCHSPV